MNAQELIDDTLGLLDDHQSEQLQQKAAQDPELAAQRDRLHQAISALLDDGDDIEPPPDLVNRLHNRIEQHQRQRSRILDFGRSSIPFRKQDVAVAAAIFIACLVTLIPAVHRSRLAYQQDNCLNNVRQIGLALGQYADAHQEYPYVNPDCPGSYVGAFALLLRDGGYLTDPAVLDCPLNGNDPVLVDVKTFDDLCAQEAKGKGTARHAVSADYAYSLGYRSQNGQSVPAPVPVRSDAFVPLLADQPPHDQTARQIHNGNSPNHGGGGQNVLFTGGQAKWLRSRFVHAQDKDLYLNEASRPAPGLHARDAVLQPAVYRFQH